MDAKGIRLGRRQVMRRVGGIVLGAGAATVVVPALAGAAEAQQATTTTTSGGSGSSTTAGSTTSAAPTTTTTLPPAKPQPADLPFLAFAQSLELAAVNVYGQALTSGRLSDASVKVATAFQGHHRDHAQSYAGMGGKAITNVVNQTLVSTFGARIQAASSEPGVLQVVLDLESALASTYTTALSGIDGTDPAYLVASILPIESRHAVVIGEALGQSPAVYTPEFEPTSAALTPAAYPIVEA